MKIDKNKDQYDPVRRRFINDCIRYTSSLALLGSLPVLTHCSENSEANAESGKKTSKTNHEGVPDQRIVARAHKGDAYDLTRRAVDALGGMSKFVNEGESVILMPNIAWDRNPDQAANTHPDVVRAVVDMCKAAGAKEIDMFCHTCHPAQSCYAKSGVAESAEKAGAKVRYVQPGRDFEEVEVNGKYIKTTKVYKKLLQSDRFISIPIAKVHSLANYTMCFKNLLGAIEDRPVLHPNIHQNVADLSMVLKPDLNIIDATRILVRNGPTGGSLADVRKPEIVIAAINPVSADSVGMNLFEKSPEKLRCLPIAQKLDRGEYDLNLLEIREA